MSFTVEKGGVLAAAPPDRRMFGPEGLCDALGGPQTAMTLRRCAEEVAAAVARFTGREQLMDG